MTLAFTWTFEEFRALQYAQLEAHKERYPLGDGSFASPATQRGIFLSCLVLATLFALVGVTQTLGHSLFALLMFIPSALPLVWSWMSYSSGQKYRARQAWRLSPDMQQARTVTVTDETIAQEQPGIRTEFAWSAASFVYESRGFFLLYVGGQMRVAIPKRAFPSAQDLKAFHDRCLPLMNPRTKGFPVVAGGQ